MLSPRSLALKGDMTLYIVPVEGDAAEFAGIVVDSDFVVFLKGSYDVFEVGFVLILDKEIIHNECKVCGEHTVLE
jgi:hypothetical protein